MTLEPGIAATQWHDSGEEMPDRLAESAAANAFWNAVARECSGVWFDDTPSGSASSAVRSGDAAPALVVSLPTRDSWLRVPVRYRSLAGRHLFGSPVTLARPKSRRGHVVSLSTAVALVIAEAALVDQVAPEKQRRFLRRFCDSLMVLSDALAAHLACWGKVYDESLDFLAAEQALLLGHPLHPTAKSRDEFSAQDVRRFSPEFGGAFGLAWFAVDPQLVATGAPSPVDAAECARELLECDPTLPAGLAERLNESGRRRLLPAHPWQAKLLLEHPSVRAYERAGRMRYLGELGHAWHATSSLRSVYATHSPWMLKCSLNVRLTNAIRTVATNEPGRGRDVHRLMTSSVGAALTAAYPAFHVLTEPTHLTLSDPAGAPIPDASVLFRSNPFQGERGGDVVMLATLCQDDPLRGGSRLSRLVARLALSNEAPPEEVARVWFGRFISVAVEPLLVARANFGLVFGAHQQNVLLRLVDGWPAASYYRDCFGTFFIAEMHAKLSAAVPGIGVDNGGLVTRETGDRYLAHNIIGNNVLNVVATLGHSGLVTESALLAVLRGRLQQLRQRDLLDASFVYCLLSASTIKVKANLRTVLHDVNEYRVAEGFSSDGAPYVDMPNPVCLGTFREWKHE